MMTSNLAQQSHWSGAEFAQRMAKLELQIDEQSRRLFTSGDQASQELRAFFISAAIHLQRLSLEEEQLQGLLLCSERTFVEAFVSANEQTQREIIAVTMLAGVLVSNHTILDRGNKTGTRDELISVFSAAMDIPDESMVHYMNVLFDSDGNDTANATERTAAQISILLYEILSGQGANGKASNLRRFLMLLANQVGLFALSEIRHTTAGDAVDQNRTRIRLSRTATDVNREFISSMKGEDSYMAIGSSIFGTLFLIGGIGTLSWGAIILGIFMLVVGVVWAWSIFSTPSPTVLRVRSETFICPAASIFCDYRDIHALKLKNDLNAEIVLEIAGHKQSFPIPSSLTVTGFNLVREILNHCPHITEVHYLGQTIPVQEFRRLF
ncbi:MAG: hypothetical protein R3C18_17775 [Planctomycetaceae bacterium]